MYIHHNKRNPQRLEITFDSVPSNIAHIFFTILCMRVLE